MREAMERGHISHGALAGVKVQRLFQDHSIVSQGECGRWITNGSRVSGCRIGPSFGTRAAKDTLGGVSTFFVWTTFSGTITLDDAIYIYVAVC